MEPVPSTMPGMHWTSIVVPDSVLQNCHSLSSRMYHVVVYRVGGWSTRVDWCPDVSVSTEPVSFVLPRMHLTAMLWDDCLCVSLLIASISILCPLDIAENGLSVNGKIDMFCKTTKAITTLRHLIIIKITHRPRTVGNSDRVCRVMFLQKYHAELTD